MSITISAHFDGQLLIPHDPLSLPVGQEVRLTIVPVGQSEQAKGAGNFSNLRQFAADLKDAPTDLSRRHDDYFYGSPDE